MDGILRNSKISSVKRCNPFPLYSCTSLDVDLLHEDLDEKPDT